VLQAFSFLSALSQLLKLLFCVTVVYVMLNEAMVFMRLQLWV